MDYRELDSLIETHKLHKMLVKHQYRHNIYNTLRDMIKAFETMRIEEVYNAAGRYKCDIYARAGTYPVDTLYQFLFRKVNK